MVKENDLKEIWRDIPGYDGKYKVSNKGRVMSFWRSEPVVVKTWDNKSGYKCLALHKGGTKITKTLHRIVAKAFVDNPNNKLEVNHIDGNKSNNAAHNLEWSTRKENVRHANKNGLARYLYGEDIPVSKLNADKVREIRRLYASGEHSHRSLAKQYGVGRNTIAAILTNRTWKHVI